MPEMSQATAGLQLVLPEIASREEQLNTVIRQFRTQLARLPRPGHLRPHSLGLGPSRTTAPAETAGTRRSSEQRTPQP